MLAGYRDLAGEHVVDPTTCRNKLLWISRVYKGCQYMVFPSSI